MQKLRGLFMSWAAVTGLVVVNPAAATPPTGQFSFTEHGRAQQLADATVSFPAYTDSVSSMYTVAPGGDTGWRTGSGDTVVAVTKGALTVEQAQQCASLDVTAGKAVVVPAGKFRLRNPGHEPTEFSGVFLNLPIGGPDPLVEGPVEAAPACGGVSPTGVVPRGVSATDLARGTLPTYSAQHRHAGHDHHAQAADDHGTGSSGTVVHSLEAGKDMFVITYVFEPGASTGWLVHTDELAILTKGAIAIWEGKDGKCQKTEEYRAGQAWAHKPHPHMATVEGNEAAVLRIIGFNMRHGEPTPIFGSNMDHIDFSQPPPSECPTRLR